MQSVEGTSISLASGGIFSVHVIFMRPTDAFATADVADVVDADASYAVLLL